MAYSKKMKSNTGRTVGTVRSRRAARVRKLAKKRLGSKLAFVPRLIGSQVHTQTFQYTVIRPLNEKDFLIYGDRANSNTLFLTLARYSGPLPNQTTTDPRDVTYKAGGNNGFHGFAQTAAQYDEFNPRNITVHSKVLAFQPQTVPDFDADPNANRPQPPAYGRSLDQVNTGFISKPDPPSQHMLPGSATVETLVYYDFNAQNIIANKPASAENFRNAATKMVKVGSSWTKIASFVPRQITDTWTQNTNAFIPCSRLFLSTYTPTSPVTSATQPRFAGCYYTHSSMSAVALGYKGFRTGEDPENEDPCLYVADKVTLTCTFRGQVNRLHTNAQSV